MSELTTLCYLIRDNQYLMLHRVKKERDINKDKWIGVGGHFLPGESPEECAVREVREETGYTLRSARFRGVVTFIYQSGEENVTEYMHLFTSDDFSGTPIECDEGELEWVDIDKVTELPIWEGDRIFFRLLETTSEFFSLKLVYRGDDLTEVSLNGRPLPL